jgi:hypothetical protein
LVIGGLDMNTQALVTLAIEELAGALGLSVVGSLLALPIMMFYARNVSWWRHALISFWAWLRSTLVVIVVSGVWIIGLHQSASSLPGWLTLVWLCAVGWTISHDLKRHRVEGTFPGIGARAMLGVLIFSWIIIGVAFLAGAFRDS